MAGCCSNSHIHANLGHGKGLPYAPASLSLDQDSRREAAMWGSSLRNHSHWPWALGVGKGSLSVNHFLLLFLTRCT